MIEPNHLIFIGGIHGVGKTTACKKLATKLGAVHLEASKLIARHLKENSPKRKNVKDVRKRQDYLLLELKASFKPTTWFILDGHFTLLDNKNAIRKIPKKVFLKMKPLLIIILTDKPGNIAARLKNRDRLIYDIDMLSKMQELEKKYARSIADSLDIGYADLPVNSTSKITALTKKTIRRHESLNKM